MVSTPSTRELRIRVVDRIFNMFGKAHDRTLFGQAAYKRCLEENVRVTKRFDKSDRVFLDLPKHDPKTTKERNEQIDQSKLVPKPTSQFQDIRAYPDVIVVYQGEIAVFVDRCSKSPAENATPTDPILYSDMTNPALSNRQRKLLVLLRRSRILPVRNRRSKIPLHVAHHEIEPSKKSVQTP